MSSLRNSRLLRWELPFIVFLLAWIALSTYLFCTHSDTATVDSEANVENADYLHVRLDIPQYDPSTGVETIEILCGLAPGARSPVAQAMGSGDDHAYDVTLQVLKPSELDDPAFSFQYPPEPPKPSGSLHIDITARGVENIVGDATQLVNAESASPQRYDLVLQKTPWWSPFDSHKVLLQFRMLVPPGLDVVDTSYGFDPGNTMPCRFYESHVDGAYRCTVEPVGNCTLQLEFYRDWPYKLLLVLPILAIVVPGILAALRPTGERGYFSGLAVSLVATIVTWGFTKSLIVPEGITDPTLLDLVIFVSLVSVVIAILLASWLHSKTFDSGG
jgi:hypothetical protein